MKGNLFMKSVLAFGILQAAVSNAGIFHTIIGPDGRPMVVQLPDKKVLKKEPVKEGEPQKDAQQSEHPSKDDLKQSNLKIESAVIAQPQEIRSSSQISRAQEQNLQQVIKKLDVKKPVPSVEERQQAKENLPSIPPAHAADAQRTKPQKQDDGKAAEQLKRPKTVQENVPPVLKLNTRAEEPKPPVSAVLAKRVQIAPAVMQSIQKNEQLNQVQSPFKTLPPDLLKKTGAAEKPLAQTEPRAGFSAIDGEQYVNSEYLEDKEFNLEGKKRFYAMPEGVIDHKVGATRMQMVEREKGVSKSIIESLFKRNQPVENGPITLSASYYRVSQADAVLGLGQQCFQEQQTKKAKNLKPQSEMNIWPRAPLKDEFDFEVIKVEKPIQNIRINSYASKQNNPTFYWPFVVFLDQQGCVLEGAGGFKNNDSAATMTQHEKIEGVIHVPQQSQYILLTPLASALDVDHRELSNHGQLKLVAIR
ncbi:hypothetical protein F941_02553 [Acinetobacter bouvetii DSM 14964 = CIP 107468]|uniref:FilE C-terminal domain-containing protein n=2 Tax=Acinetobacter bouvetii TaxID=202951 RepID=N9DNU4_9GAMM|nr:putative pilus assembly protein FilE [Acinetobacter bouvetii]ENV82108.1 hypothetical protein F941_02553 [Acinetobacter bouvetii DSM 14964 = CIP 107468]BCU63851.1 hypothetical protein ACBO_06420 [Acinetobacter bouvetii]